MAPRPSEVKGKSVESRLSRVGGWQAVTLRAVHDLILAAAPDAAHGLKWGMPFYEEDGPVLLRKAVALNRGQMIFGPHHQLSWCKHPGPARDHPASRKADADGGTATVVVTVGHGIQII